MKDDNFFKGDIFGPSFSENWITPYLYVHFLSGFVLYYFGYHLFRDRERAVIFASVLHLLYELKDFAAEIHRTNADVYHTVVVPNVLSDSWYCEINLANVNKWHGLSQLATLFNIGAENICAVGDQVNDVPMLKEVAHGVAMGNGVDALHRHAKFVCGNHDEDGILEVIDYIRAHNKTVSK